MKLYEQPSSRVQLLTTTPPSWVGLVRVANLALPPLFATRLWNLCGKWDSRPNICHQNGWLAASLQLGQHFLCGKSGTVTAVCHTSLEFVWQMGQ